MADSTVPQHGYGTGLPAPAVGKEPGSRCHGQNNGSQSPARHGARSAYLTWSAPPDSGGGELRGLSVDDDVPAKQYATDNPPDGRELARDDLEICHHERAWPSGLRGPPLCPYRNRGRTEEDLGLAVRELFDVLKRLRLR